MVEQHDECLECLAKIKNRTDLYRTLVDNNKPSNNVIKVSQVFNFETLILLSNLVHIINYQTDPNPSFEQKHTEPPKAFVIGIEQQIKNVPSIPHHQGQRKIHFYTQTEQLRHHFHYS